ncbi:MAG: DUF2147 domain-containing protein [Minicystis sp.]
MTTTRSFTPVLALLATISGSPQAVAAPMEAPFPAQQRDASPDVILGKWKPADNDLVVEVSKCGSHYVGIVTESPKKPEHVGKQLLRNVVYDATKRVWSGEILAPKRGELFPMVVTMKGDAALVMQVGTGLLSREVTWSRK